MTEESREMTVEEALSRLEETLEQFYTDEAADPLLAKVNWGTDKSALACLCRLARLGAAVERHTPEVKGKNINITGVTVQWEEN